MYPPKPDFKTTTKQSEKMALWGTMEYKSAPVQGNPENIVITNDWAKENIIMVQLPQLSKLGFGSRAQFHKKAAGQLQALFMAWDAAGLLSYIKQWGGTYCPRFIRGSTSTLSNHAFGTAFDINVPWNPLGGTPASEESKGTVIPLVEIANQMGFFWGGHYDKRLDGMHFECVKPYVDGQFETA